jgi:hypothetical protein
VEKTFGLRFPDDYRAFVKSHRGGSPSPQEIRISGRRGPGVFQTLLNSFPTTTTTFSRITIGSKIVWHRASFRSRAIRQATTSASTFVARGDPTLVWWEHEGNARKRYLPIAKSFTELLDSLYGEE